jgi:hypothetical protein
MRRQNTSAEVGFSRKLEDGVAVVLDPVAE